MSRFERLATGVTRHTQGDGTFYSELNEKWGDGKNSFTIAAEGWDGQGINDMLKEVKRRLMADADAVPIPYPHVGDGRLWDGNRWLEIAPTNVTYALLDLLLQHDQLRAAAKTVMDDLQQHGASIVPHLLDSDDNAGERLRLLIAKGSK